MKPHALFAFAAAALLAYSAAAIDISQAKQQGLVGERTDGYLGAVQSSPGAEVEGLIESINRLRKAEYERIAKQNGQSVQVVESLAAQKALQQTRPGHYVMNASGEWVKK